VKATGIVRRLDDLGRVVIPKEIRRTLRIHEGDPVEIFVDRNGEVVLKKYSPLGDLDTLAQEYSEVLHKATGLVVLVFDEDSVIAAAGPATSTLLGRGLGASLERALRNPSTGRWVDDPTRVVMPADADSAFTGAVVTPIVCRGRTAGAVVLASRDAKPAIGEIELKLAETAANFMARHIEG
jgi:AbrB family transcriptional regulator (stage V sporulation protein T)